MKNNTLYYYYLEVVHWVYDSCVYTTYSRIKYFLMNSWKYRSELANTYHVDYLDELLPLIIRFNKEFAKDCVINRRNYTESEKDAELLKLNTLMKLFEQIYEDDYFKRDSNGNMYYDDAERKKHFKMISEHLHKYAGEWWI